MAEQNGIIQLKDIDVTFHNEGKTIEAVKDVSINVNKGDVFGVIGYSGAGKSTLVRVINLLQKPTSGTVVVNDQNLTQLSAKDLRKARRNIGMIFQHFNLMNSLTVYGNVDFPLRDSGLSKAERKQKIDKLLDIVGLSDRAKNYPSQLSGGQKQRVAIARALANDPEILISDEATSALDPKTTTEILNLLGRLNEELGITIVIITHEMDAIKQVCNRVAVMENGELIEEGSLLSIFGNPKQQLTKDFVNTSTHIGSVLDEIRSSGIVDKLSGRLIELNYIGDSTNEPIVVELYKRFQVEANILFSNIERLQSTTVGIMLFALTGDDDKVEQAIQYLNSLKVNVKEISLKKEGE
ncbi:ABC-type metal ion transport system, ATPase component [Companilactobacillus paralimentarius DSM 13238 = JCM 10415]|jgi:ABC-type metal ion transport system, ATPase component|uniref:ABC-type metal ion transport system, ATPase component n=1 Tax=Companilactobacillus paralimentarius DSM 13238 = JCM 10415 TaxID=1122151 RepID=A0A0R1PBQ8_9LACO|nr:ATP-binding cassette domain-containing protein [Companilactobacillus paralimentarius]KAE9565433.1 methionine ABC transporter ATP-binding protein [Companilactobacillus paralimentarius]KRL29911.1 ABC-type metal ion transport system, ATPase component [Companilactobacillus paralimentarius DSM 13238 = JCM 10415]MDR4933506.1 ATP-binding cassette domain-containing protein [Companilactobacillus paralimentarius]QFR69985.1 ATP-binding cassette domain-containing protein [Companilactobacillus paraliment